MDRWNAKTVAFVLAVLVVVSIFGMAVMRLKNAAQEPPDTRTAEQRLNALESSKSIQSPGARNFITDERERREATKQAEKDAAGE